MILRLRRRAPLYLAIGLFLMAWSLTARATTPVLESHMRSFVYWTLAVVLGAVITAAAAFVSYLMARLERTLEKSITRLEKTVDDFSVSMSVHHIDPDAHPAGSKARIDPLNVKLDVLAEKLDGLIGEHRAIRESESDICAALRMRRDDGSPGRKRRANDPADFDGVKLRGRQ